ncbi:hypothetical protein KV205_31590 [Streptomyces sp. SKN60]|uniref:hypothetical protein n=1 Tax=Streptomyces sp. SKN60 TaxID=2855506 RepID=UPI002247FD3E|nr:hypothetical protein [Streptomyces sp. SKN60]MCX2185026.1 hypothetical protein [Streptomyces sp. SKN60]
MTQHAPSALHPAEASMLPCCSDAAAADASTRHVQGGFTLQFHAPGSAEGGSSQGPSLTGAATGDLAGEVFIEVLPATVAEGSARTVSQSGAKITITRPDGQLDGVAAGLLDHATGEHSNWIYWTGGTGSYANATGRVITDGPINLATGQEHSSYHGTLITRP